MDSVGPSSEIVVRNAKSLSLKSKQDILIEAVALEKLKKNAEQAEETVEVECIDQLIALAFIEKWIDLGITVCPTTRQIMAHTFFIPNYTMKALVANWCKSNNVKLPDPMESTSLNQVYPFRATEVKTLVEDLKSTSTDTQRVATTQLRLLTKQSRDNRIIIANCGAVSLLVDLLYSPDIMTRENAVTALLNLSNIYNNKTAIANANAIELLIHVLETRSPVAKENLAATLFSLSVIEVNRVRIGIWPLVDLLRNAGMVDKAVVLLANLATIPEGRSAIAQEGGIPRLDEVVELGSVRGKEHATAALLQLCTTCRTAPPLVALSRSGTPTAKGKAQVLLSYFRNQRHANAESG
ncbi:hypothetical protein GOBAR_AA12263 [Gossypium barbadense]|uniref:RING-type E3 ubiquitin transferase n=1 Tax=Gossypium barbadense TaxID=3634 RepID=A0A2P5XYI7_GOSBA|nr:hypothetical protein GOBAR_AA12263 [Gossypium barbadense]